MAEGCLPPLNALIDTCHSLGIPVIYTQHGHLDPEAEEASSVLVRWWGAGGSIRCALAPAAARREQAQQIPAYRCAALCAQPLSPPPPSPRYGSPAWQLLPELRRHPGQDAVITSKRTYDAFQGTDLLQLLQRLGCGTVIVGGVMTNLCCETTARWVDPGKLLLFFLLFFLLLLCSG